MRLYHGTSGAAARKAMTEGIRPRERRRGNFSHSIESSPHHVYLTDAYAAYFAFGCSDNEAAILEVETDHLQELCLNADEDVLEQAGRGRDGLDPSWDMKKRTLWYRRRIQSVRYDWRASLAGMGTCSHFGIIPPEAITRVVYIDVNHINVQLLRLAALDASISLLNYRFMEKKYKALTRWLFEDDDDSDRPQVYDTFLTDYETGEKKPHTFQEYAWPPAGDRRGIRLFQTRTQLADQ